MTTREYIDYHFGEGVYKLDNVTPQEFTDIAKHVFRDYLEDVKNGNDSVDKEYIIDVDEEAKALNKTRDQIYSVMYDHWMGMPFVNTLTYYKGSQFRLTMDNSMLNLAL